MMVAAALLMLMGQAAHAAESAQAAQRSRPPNMLPPGVRAHGVRVSSVTEGADPPGMDGKGVRLLSGPWLSTWNEIDPTTRAGVRPEPRPVTLVLDDSGALLLKGTYATQANFGDMQLHVEFRVPSQRDGSSISYSELELPQGCRIVMTDSMNRPQRPNSCGAILDIAAPTTAAALPPGGWQTFDIFYRAARAGSDGTISEPARVTLLHNGVLVQNAVALPPTKDTQPVRGPIMLKELFGEMHVRNIWVRNDEPLPPPFRAGAVAPSPAPAPAPPPAPPPAPAPAPAPAPPPSPPTPALGTP